MSRHLWLAAVTALAISPIIEAMKRSKWHQSLTAIDETREEETRPRSQRIYPDGAQIDQNSDDQQLIEQGLTFLNLTEHYNAETLKQNPNLHVLILGNNNFMALPQEIFYLKHLISLTLSYNLITPQGLVVLANLTNLEFLGLRDCGLKTIPLDLVLMPKLKTIDLIGNELSEEVIVWLEILGFINNDGVFTRTEEAIAQLSEWIDKVVNLQPCKTKQFESKRIPKSGWPSHLRC